MAVTEVSDLACCRSPANDHGSHYAKDFDSPPASRCAGALRFLLIGFTFAEPKFATAAGPTGSSETGSKPPVSGSGSGVAKGGHSNSIPGKQADAGRSGGGVPSRGERRFVPKEVILGFRPSTTVGSIDQLVSRYRVTRLGSQDFPLIGIKLYRWRVNGNRSVAATVRAIERESLVATAQRNYVFTLQEDQPNYSAGADGDAAQCVLGKLQIEQAHQIATGKEVTIAIIDAGPTRTKHEWPYACNVSGDPFMHIAEAFLDLLTG